MVGVNKHGGNVKEYVAEMQRVFDSEAPVIFLHPGWLAGDTKEKSKTSTGKELSSRKQSSTNEMLSQFSSAAGFQTSSTA